VVLVVDPDNVRDNFLPLPNSFRKLDGCRGPVLEEILLLLALRSPSGNALVSWIEDRRDVGNGMRLILFRAEFGSDLLGLVFEFEIGDGDSFGQSSESESSHA